MFQIDQADDDMDGVGNACEEDGPDPVDYDEDGVPDLTDNCVRVINANQANADGDLWGMHVTHAQTHLNRHRCV